MVEQFTKETIHEAQELNELYYRRWAIKDRSTRVSDDQPKPRLPLLSKGSDPELAKYFEDKLNGS